MACAAIVQGFPALVFSIDTVIAPIAGLEQAGGPCSTATRVLSDADKLLYHFEADQLFHQKPVLIFGRVI